MFQLDNGATSFTNPREDFHLMGRGTMATETLLLSSLAPEAGEVTTDSQRCREPLEYPTLPMMVS